MTVPPDGTVDPEHTSQLALNLAKGSFRLSIVPIARDLATAIEHWRYHEDTCSVGIRFTAPAPVVAGSGTGAGRAGCHRFRHTVSAADRGLRAGDTEPTGHRRWLSR